jgi:hypothetical protein
MISVLFSITIFKINNFIYILKKDFKKLNENFVFNKCRYIDDFKVRIYYNFIIVNYFGYYGETRLHKRAY